MQSFDVFDTVLTRSVGDPDAVSVLLGRRARDRGVLTAEPLVLARARGEVERRLLRLRAGQPALRDIHEELVLTLGAGGNDVAKKLLELELELERELSRVVPGAPARVAEARATGAQVAFVSDTPLPGTFLTELLTAADLYQDGDLVYSSADAGVRKSGDGALFERVARDLGLEPSAIHHTGDNALSDVANARLRGLSAELRRDAALNRYERLLETEALVSDGIASRLAGASRLARLESVHAGVPSARAGVAAGVATPLLVGYGLWLLRQAEQRGLRRLYFLSRDGEVILDVVRPLAEALGYRELECRYLYGSRAAWRPASLHYVESDDLSDWLHGDPSSSPRTVLHRVGLTPEGARQLVAHPLLADPRCDEPLDSAGLAALQRLVQRDPLRRDIRRRSGEAAALAVDYLRQEGLGGDTPVGLVDVGWLGRTTRGLVDVMAGAGLRLPDAFFFIGVRSGSSRWSSPPVAERQVAYLFDHTNGHGLPGDLSGRVTLIEMLCAGTEGSTLGYRRGPDQVEPVLLQPRNEQALEWGLGEVRTTIRRAVTHLLDGDPDELRRLGDLRSAIDLTLRQFWDHPTPEEVRTWGSFPFEADDAHRSSTRLATPIRWRDVLGELRLGRVRLRPASSWRAGTAAVSPAPWRHVLTAVATAQRHQPRLARLPRRLRSELVLRRS